MNEAHALLGKNIAATVAEQDRRIAELEADVKFWNTAFLEQRESAEKEVARLSNHIRQIAAYHHAALLLPTPETEDPRFRDMAVRIANVMREMHTARRDFALSAIK